MTKERLFANTLATNGLARGYGLRSHRRKRKGLWMAVFILLLALAGVVYINVAHAEAMKWGLTKGGKLVDISLCKQVIEDGDFLAEEKHRDGYSLYYRDGSYLYRQDFYWNNGFKLSCSRWISE